MIAPLGSCARFLCLVCVSMGYLEYETFVGGLYCIQAKVLATVVGLAVVCVRVVLGCIGDFPMVLPFAGVCRLGGMSSNRLSKTLSSAPRSSTLVDFRITLECLPVSGEGVGVGLKSLPRLWAGPALLLRLR